MAVVFSNWDDLSHKTAVSKIILFRLVLGVTLFCYIVGGSSLIGLGIGGKFLLFFAVLFRLTFDSLYGYARAVIRQDIMGLMTLVESISLFGGIFIASYYSSIENDFFNYSMILFFSYAAGTAVGLSKLFNSLYKFIFAAFKTKIKRSQFVSLVGSGISIYPIACIDMLWLSGTVFVLVKIGQLDLVPLYVLLQRVCTMIALMYSIPNSLLSQIVSTIGGANKKKIVIVGFLSITISGIVMIIILSSFSKYILLLFNITYEKYMDEHIFSYIFGYCLVLLFGFFASILLSIGKKTIVFIFGLVFWIIICLSIPVFDLATIESVNVYITKIILNLAILLTGLLLVLIVNLKYQQ